MQVDESPSSLAGPSSIVSPAHQKRLLQFPWRWEAIVSAPIEEADADIFLQTISIALDQNFIPNSLHFRLLLFLSLTETPSQSSFALRIISQIISQCPPTSIGPLIPTLPHKSSIPPKGFEGNNRLKKGVEGFMAQSQGIQGGIWGILGGWRGLKGKKRKLEEMEMELKRENTRPRRGVGKDQETSDEEEEEIEEIGKEGEQGVICENGWKVLGWFVDLWKIDQKDHKSLHPDEPWSPLFFEQLPHDPSPHSMKQMDDAKLPLRVIRAGLYQADLLGQTTSSGMRILEICKSLLSLIIPLALPFDKRAKFHPLSLPTSLISTFKPLPPHLFHLSLSLISPSFSLYPHLLTIFIEDLSGVRTRKVSARRDNALILAKEFDITWSADSGGTSSKEKNDNNFPPPTLCYLGEILLSKPLLDNGEIRGKMRLLKLQLIRWCIVNYDQGVGWGFVFGEGWEDGFRNSMVGGDEVELEEILGMMKELGGVP